MEITNLGFEEICRKLKEYASTLDLEPVITLPEIFGKMRDELFVSAWLAHLLNPRRNGFGVAPLRAMLGTDHLIDEDEEIEIEREHTFDDERRIDIRITTVEYLIGIEIKIQSDESPNQTRDYWRSICKESKAEGKEPVCIFLSPMKPKDDHFRHMSYADLCGAFKAIPYDIRRDSRKNSIFFEFILYVEEKLMKTVASGFPRISKDVQIYMDHLSTIREVEEQYNKYVGDFKAWLCEKTKLEEGGWIPEEPQKNYWIIRQREDWNRRSESGYDFHFELMWDGDKRKINELSDNDAVTLVVHLEGGNKQVKARFRANGHKLPQEKVSVNFQTEENSKKSIKMITEKLRTGKFQEIAQRINEFLDSGGAT